MTKLTDLKPGPDSLALIIDTIEGALLPMMKSMLPVPTLEQLTLLIYETQNIDERVKKIKHDLFMEMFEKGEI